MRKCIYSWSGSARSLKAILRLRHNIEALWELSWEAQTVDFELENK